MSAKARHQYGIVDGENTLGFNGGVSSPETSTESEFKEAMSIMMPAVFEELNALGKLSPADEAILGAIEAGDQKSNDGIGLHFYHHFLYGNNSRESEVVVRLAAIITQTDIQDGDPVLCGTEREASFVLTTDATLRHIQSLSPWYRSAIAKHLYRIGEQTIDNRSAEIHANPEVTDDIDVIHRKLRQVLAGYCGALKEQTA